MKKADKVKIETFGGSIIVSKKSSPQNKLLVVIPMTGLIRGEWALARYGQIIPCNWSVTEHVQWVDQFSPFNFLVADARNIGVHHFLAGDFEWLCFIDSDVMLPPMFYIKISDIMRGMKVPVFSGLYFTKSIPSEPLIYRGRGTGYYKDWKIGDKVWVDGIPMGCTLIHRSILETYAKEAPSYSCYGTQVKKVFETPSRIFYDPENRQFNTQTGTEDLEFCTQVMKRKILEKAGWKKLAKEKHPFLIDTSLFCYHIDQQGQRYPAQGEQMKFIRKGAKPEVWTASQK